MPAPCPELETLSRKNLAAILRSLASAGQARVAEAVGIDESAVSRMKEKELPRLAKALAVMGLKVVPTTLRCFDPQFIEALLQLAKARLADVDRADQLAWDDPA